MIFNVVTAGKIYDDQAQIDRLKKLGFTFEEWGPREPSWGHTGTEQRISGKVSIEINTLEELITFIAEYGDVIIEQNEKHNRFFHCVPMADTTSGYWLKIYDDYVE